MSTKGRKDGVTALRIVKSKEEYIQKAAMQKGTIVIGERSELNRQFFIRIYIFVLHCTYRNVIRATNFACIHTVTLYVLILGAHSRSPTMRSIQLVV